MKIYKIIFILFLSFQFANTFAQESHDFEISKNLDIYTSLIQQLNLHYVDEIQPGTLTKAAIDAMLSKIDPYTVYYPESEIEDVRFLQTGQYGGIGSYVHIKNKQVVVGMPYPGFPFYNAGLRAGDVITRIDGEDLTGRKMSEISDKLRGVSGTEINIIYKSSIDSTQHNVSIKREQIVVKDVPYFGLLENGIAYIKLTSFKQNAAKEVKQALDSLSKESEITSLVFDLRDNGGGLLIQAVNIMDLFVEQGEKIVSTKGKTKNENNTYGTRRSAAYGEMKVVVLTNKRSASASEIVAGAFQDLDRGVIMGQKSYGKGLVQKVYQLSYRSQAKITIAKYYIPSGRCIQSLDYQHKDKYGNAIKTPDSLMAVFKTRNGRLVRDAGGIIPDIKLPEAKYSDVSIALINQWEIFDFATNYTNSHDSIKSVSDFEITDDIYNLFVVNLEKDSFDYSLAIELELKKLKKLADSKDYSMEPELIALQSKIDKTKEEAIIKHKQEIKSLLRQELVSRYFFNSGKVEAALTDDAEVAEAIKLLKDADKYNQILGVVE